ncbi:hypothetical protein D0869_08542 [Hortaea werneckii]|uniref:AB hydrolase-1 domain-containing protein n=1 Tax=Hortaea werneckii TaxID=91943 RepID=A0A3M6WLF1_HORWE|nr:hypothetical protein KC334_g6094 [Hortaea werneckii]KAI6958065.1 hypothetical protein KC355_g13008 [Hortaea werneckii]KAI7184433.1 hypothetical protein KC324_g7701 [Hortaea werneckii]KAI7582596.1 hypothetical protein KC316_g7767 [Hortaea werneckii]KAI7667356.1 hypothetical protein KC318_g5922 [Hortaea werneckii]
MKPTLQDVIYFDPPSTAKPKDSAQGALLVFFITGNPGLIAYYGPFLDRLQSLLCDDDRIRGDSKYYTYGASLAGFEVNGDKSSRNHSSSVHDGPYGLQEQIDKVAARLEHVAGSIKSSAGQSVPVVLIGHSVGSYILLEIVSKWQSRQKAGPSSSLPYDIIGGICLFPTVVDIAKSPTGRRMTPLLNVPAFPAAVHYVARPLCWLPFWVVVYLVGLVTGMPNNMATVTAAFLCSENGVRQALHMAHDEMHEITHDKFSDDVWGTSGTVGDEEKTLQSKATAVVNKQAAASRASHMRRQTTKLYFYWGKNDHWVADNTRDAILAARAQKATDNQGLEKAKPVMDIDQHGIPHGFCLNPVHSDLVATKVANWVKEIRTNHVNYQRNAL